MSMKVHLFGRFCLSNGDLSLSEKDFHSNKLVKLLVYILLYRHRNLTHQELMKVSGKMTGQETRRGR